MRLRAGAYRKSTMDDDWSNETEVFPAEVETTGPETKNGVIINSLFVKVRKEPSFESEVLEVMGRDDKVKILGQVGRFYEVSTSANECAYIFSDFVKEE